MGESDGIALPKKSEKNLEAKINFKYGDILWDVLRKLEDYARITPDERNKVGRFIKKELKNGGNGLIYDALVNHLITKYEEKLEYELNKKKLEIYTGRR